MFDNINVSTVYPHQDYISEQYDSIKKVAVLTFNPKFDYNGSDDISYLKDDTKNGKLKGYTLQYEIDKNDSIALKKTTVTYSKIIKEFMTLKDVPSFDVFLDKEIVEKQRVIAQNQEVIRQDKIKFNEIMGDDDFWNEFDIMVKERVYTLIKNKDCRELQKEFNITADHADRFHKIRDSRASKHTSLMSFIDDKMRELECY